jgi:WD40 repeat protein
LTAGGDSVRIWNAHTFKPLADPMRHLGRIDIAALSSDGRRVLTAGADGALRVWAADRGRQLWVGKHDGPILSAAFSRDSTFVVSGSKDRTAQIWEAATGKKLATIRRENEVDQVIFNPAGDKLMTLSASTIRIFDVKSGKAEKSPERVEIGVCFYATFSPDGKYLISAGQSSAHVIDVATGTEIATADVWPHDSPWSIVEAAYAPSGAKFATATTGSIQIWDAATGKPVTNALRGDDLRYFNSVAFSANGDRLLAAGGTPTSKKHVWMVWDARSAKRLEVVRYESPGMASALSPEGTLIAAGGIEADDTAVWRLSRDN